MGGFIPFAKGCWGLWRAGADVPEMDYSWRQRQHLRKSFRALRRNPAFSARPSGEPPGAVVIGGGREGIRASRPPKAVPPNEEIPRPEKFDRHSENPCARWHIPDTLLFVSPLGAAEDLRVMAQVPQDNRIETIQ
jgi:hypothetical protein